MKLLAAIGYVPKRDVEKAQRETERLLRDADPDQTAIAVAEEFRKVAKIFERRARDDDRHR